MAPAAKQEVPRTPPTAPGAAPAAPPQLLSGLADTLKSIASSSEAQAQYVRQIEENQKASMRLLDLILSCYLAMAEQQSVDPNTLGKLALAIDDSQKAALLAAFTAQENAAGKA
jgi:hypothetical protein